MINLRTGGQPDSSLLYHMCHNHHFGILGASQPGREAVMKDRDIAYFAILASCMICVFAFCGGVAPSDPTGFGKWADDCSGIAVAVNHEDWDSRLFANHGANERTDLHLCDTNGTIVTTLYTSRKVDGGDNAIDSLEYSKSSGYIMVYSLLYGKGKIKKEKITIATKAIEFIEYIDIDTNWHAYRRDLTKCNGKSISWNYGTKWIEVKK